MASVPPLANLGDDEFDALIRKVLNQKFQDLLQGRLPRCTELPDEEIAFCIDYSLNRLSPKQRRERINEHLKTCSYHGALFCLLISKGGSRTRHELN